MRLRSSFRARAAAAVGILAVLLVTTTGLFLVVSARQRFEAQLEEDARLFASLATRPICQSYEVYFESGFYKFRQFVDHLLEQAPDVVAIEVLDVEGQVLFDSRRPLREGTADALPDPRKRDAARGLQTVVLPGQGHGGAFEIVQPFLEDWGRHRLSVSYHVTRAHVRRQLRRYALATLVLTLGSLVLAGLVAWALASRVTRPLEALTLGARRLAEGDLEHRLEVRTGDEIQVLAEAFNEMAARLQATIDDLEHRNVELERFTYTVSHDLRSPLVTVNGFLGMLEKDAKSGDPARVAEDIARIRRATATMDRLLRELLELSRVGRVTALPEPVPLGELAHEAAGLVDGRLRERGIVLDVAPGLPVLFGDRARLREVVQNLLDNAAKFMGDQPEPRIEIGWRPGTDPPVCFVRDNGMGIEPEHHQAAFELFRRLHAGIEGTGVGLSLVKRIVEVHGGRHGPGPGPGPAHRGDPRRSRLGGVGGRRPRLHVLLHHPAGGPRGRGLATATLARPPGRWYKCPGISRLHDRPREEGELLNILLVEDNPDHAALVERSLEEGAPSARLVTVPDGEEALRYLRREDEWADATRSPRPQLILLDLRLPRLDGFAVLRAVKESPALRPIPVVVLTTSEADPDIARSYGLHANSYLVKPVEYERFVALMRDVERYWLGWNRGGDPRRDGRGAR